MVARPFAICVVSAFAALAGGCCCCPCLPRPIVWTGECHECGPGHGQSCADCCGDCSILGCLRRCATCGKGCGEIYLGEWISDPPDCCDPCDQCFGCYTGPRGACCLGPFQRLLAACHGYSYCPPPDCGPSCGGFCNRGSCGAACGGGCATCGGGPHGAVLSGSVLNGGVPYGRTVSEGVLPPPANVNLLPTPAEESHSVLEENWDQPKTRPVPGRPIHKAQQPPRTQTSSLQRPAMSRAVGTGVRQANYLR